MLGAMFSGNLPSSVDKDGCYFIDRDGEIFRYILQFLRSDELSLPKDFKEFNLLKREIDFYQIEPLIQMDLKPKEGDFINQVNLCKQKQVTEIILIYHSLQDEHYFEVIYCRRFIDESMEILHTQNENSIFSLGDLNEERIKETVPQLEDCWSLKNEKIMDNIVEFISFLVSGNFSKNAFDILFNLTEEYNFDYIYHLLKYNIIQGNERVL